MIKEISDVVKYHVQQKKETVDEIAMACDISKATLYRIINGKKCYTIESLHRVCAYFGITIKIK